MVLEMPTTCAQILAHLTWALRRLGKLVYRKIRGYEIGAYVSARDLFLLLQIKGTTNDRDILQDVQNNKPGGGIT